MSRHLNISPKRAQEIAQGAQERAQERGQERVQERTQERAEKTGLKRENFREKELFIGSEPKIHNLIGCK